MSAEKSIGLCPSCEREGPLGRPCPQPVCLRRGYHHIPTDNVLEMSRSGLLDPVLGQLWGDYLIVQKLGGGGVGNVYLALQFPIGMKAALKLLDNGNGPPNEALTDRFRGEAAALARLSHPNIVRLLKFGSHYGRPYLVMEYVEEGRTLREEMLRGMEPEKALRILNQLINALESAHAAGVIHRDIKPPNIMLQRVPGEEAYVRLVDFGLAKFLDDGDQTRFLAGTPSYMAPEQILRKGIGPWSDWYAVGAIAFEMITQRRPYPGDSADEVIALKRDLEYDPCQNLQDLHLPFAVEHFLRRALAHDPNQRLRDASSMRVSLSAAFEALAGPLQGIPASPEYEQTLDRYGSSLEMLGELRRRPLKAGVGLLVLGFALLGVLLTLLLSEPAPTITPQSKALSSSAPDVMMVQAEPLDAAPTPKLDLSIEDLSRPAPPPQPKPPKLPTPYELALERARSRRGLATAEALLRALRESKDVKALRRQARKEPLFLRLNHPEINRILRISPKKAPAGLEMKRL